MANNSIDQLEERLGADWKHIRVARQLAETTRADLRRALADHDTADASVVVSGSLARDEFTTGSDIDWTLLIDGAADWNHHDLAAKIRAEIDKVAAKPTGAEGTFGRMVFSHDLIHQIGGEDDTNRNTTRRVLLLMESKALGREDAHDRVVRK